MTRSLRWTLAVVITLTAILLAVLLDRSDLGERTELWTYDWRFELRGPLGEPAKAPIVILALDPDSFDQIQEPLAFWQPLFAEVVTALGQAQASVIGVDFVFRDVDRWVTREGEPSHKRQLAAGMLTADSLGTRVILGYSEGVGGQGADDIPLELRLAADLAYVNLTTDRDDFVRRQELVSVDQEGEPAYGFAMAVARAFLQDQEIEFPPLPGKPGTALINYRGIDSFPRVPMWEVREAAATRDAAALARFAGKIVLVGLISEDDRHPTPLYHWVEEPPRRTPGVEIHAAMIATLLEANFIRAPGDFVRVACIALLAVAASLLCYLLPPVQGTIASLALAPAYFLLALGFFHYGIWIPVAAPVVGVLIAATVAQVANYVLEGREKKRMRNLFKRYVDDQVIEQILERPELVLQVKRRRISVLFSDIRDFTGRSETMTPEQLVELLNRYFELMVDAIQSERGTVDKFIGDGIMAVFGAPLDDPDSAYHATRAALAMRTALAELNIELEAEGQKPLDIGIGIHTGEAVVGNIGSPERLEYTAIGDVVNTASRIEGLNKRFGSDILISGETLRGLKERIPATRLTDTHVKGKARAIEVFQVDAQLPGQGAAPR